MENTQLSPPNFVLPAGGVSLDAVEKALIEQALHREAGNQSRAARLLGVSRYALRYRIEKHGISVSPAA